MKTKPRAAASPPVSSQEGLNRLVTYAAGEGVYFLALQFLVMGYLARTLSSEAFGAFALIFSLAVLVSSVASRTLQHTTIRLYRAEERHKAPYWRLYRRIWGAGALAAGGLGLVATLALGGIVGLPASYLTLGTGAAVGAFAVTQIVFDATSTSLRIRRRFGTAAMTLIAYSAVLLVAVVVIPPGSFPLWAFVLAGGLTGVGVSLGVIKQHIGDQTAESKAAPPPSPATKTFRVFAAFSAVSLLVRYLDRFVVGHVLGVESAGAFFALNNSAMAALIPAAFLGRYLHGYLAQCATVEGLPEALMRKVRAVGPATLLPGLFVAAACGFVVLKVVYPGVRMDGLVLPWIAFVAGRTWYAARWIWEPFLSRFGMIDTVLRFDLLVLPLEAIAVFVGARVGGLSGALYASGAVFVVAGVVPWRLCQGLWSGAPPTSRTWFVARAPMPAPAEPRG